MELRLLGCTGVLLAPEVYRVYYNGGYSVWKQGGRVGGCAGECVGGG